MSLEGVQILTDWFGAYSSVYVFVARGDFGAVVYVRYKAKLQANVCFCLVWRDGDTLFWCCGICSFQGEATSECMMRDGETF